METVTTKDLPAREERRKIGDRARAIYDPMREQLEKDHCGEYITIHTDMEICIPTLQLMSTQDSS